MVAKKRGKLFRIQKFNIQLNRIKTGMCLTNPKKQYDFKKL